MAKFVGKQRETEAEEKIHSLFDQQQMLDKIEKQKDPLIKLN